MPRLRVKRVDTVGFVDKGDDPEARVVFWKRAVSKQSFAQLVGQRDARERIWRLTDTLRDAMQSTLDDDEQDAGAREAELKRSLAEFQVAALATLPELVAAAPTKGSDDMDKSKIPMLKQLLSALGFRPEDVDQLKDEPVAPDGAGPDLTALHKRLEDAEKRAQAAEQAAQALTDERERERFIQKASGFAALGANPDDFGPMLRKCADALGTEAFAKFETLLRAANAQIETGRLYAEVGRGGAGLTSVEAQVDTLAAEVRKARPELSADLARAEVWRTNPTLYAAFERERQDRTRSAGGGA